MIIMKPIYSNNINKHMNNPIRTLSRLIKIKDLITKFKQIIIWGIRIENYSRIIKNYSTNVYAWGSSVKNINTATPTITFQKTKAPMKRCYKQKTKF